MSSIPATWDEVTPEWMTSMIGARFGGAVVDRAECTWSSDGSNRRARFELEYAEGEGPPVVFVKAEGAHRETHHRNGNLFNEPRLLGSSVPLPVDHAEPYGVAIDVDGLDWIVVMEDVTTRGADMRDATKPMDAGQAIDGVRGLARLHGSYWGAANEVPELDWLQTWAPTDGFQFGLRKMAPRGLERATGDLPDAIGRLDGDAVVDLWARYVDLLDRGPLTLLHADAHVGNTYVLPDDSVGFIDWQVARRGNWSQDVGHFFPGAVTIDVRREADEAMLTAYLDELDRGIDIDEAWLWYRASAFYGLAIWLSTLGTDGYQPHEVSFALVERFSAAAVDLDAWEALRTLEARGG